MCACGKFIQSDQCLSIASAHRPQGTRRGAAAHSHVDTLNAWLKHMEANLLHKEVWTDEAKSNFTSFVADLQREWVSVSALPVFPKVHMLAHIVPFVEQHGALGLYSEAQIDSVHAEFTYSATRRHFNVNGNAPEMMRRMLADHLIAQVQNRIN